MTDLILGTLINFAFFSLIAEGIYAIWIANAKDSEEKSRRSKSKVDNWNDKGRWILLGLIVISYLARALRVA